MEGLRAAQHLIADKGHGSDKLVEQAKKQGIQVQIPARKSRKNPREYDKHLHRQRYLVENACAYIKQWRGSATRYARRLSLLPLSIFGVSFYGLEHLSFFIIHIHMT